MKRIGYVLLFSLTFLFVYQATACNFDVECPVGAKCMYFPNQLFGMCFGATQPTDELIQYRADAGTPCENPTDCGFGTFCESVKGLPYKVCK